jgi:hypothetical protein
MSLTSLAFNCVARSKSGCAAAIWPAAANVRARDTHSAAEVQGRSESCASRLKEEEEVVVVEGIRRMRHKRGIRRGGRKEDAMSMMAAVAAALVEWLLFIGEWLSCDHQVPGGETQRSRRGGGGGDEGQGGGKIEKRTFFQFFSFWSPHLRGPPLPVKIEPTMCCDNIRESLQFECVRKRCHAGRGCNGCNGCSTVRAGCRYAIPNFAALNKWSMT